MGRNPYWTLTLMADPDDPGVSWTYDSVLEAFRALRWANEQGLWFVKLWK